MNKIFACVLIASMIVGGFSTACTTSGTAYHNTYDVSSATGANCVAASAGCATAYSDSNTGIPNSPITADCTYCAIGYGVAASSAWSATAATTACQYCANGYTNAANTTTPAAAQTSCTFCATSYRKSSLASTATCISSTASSTVKCDAAYSDVAPVNGTNSATSTTGTVTGDCKYCDATAAWDSLLMTKCIVKASNPTGCATGYSDLSTGTATATGTTLTGDCKYCTTAYALDRISGVTGQKCIVKASNPTGCATGYSDTTTGTATATGTTLTGDCKYCATGYAYNQASTATTGLACVSKTNTTSGKCSTGYSDVSTGVASAAGALTGDCKFCATGYSDLAPVNGTNKDATAAGATAACQYCATGYNQTAVGAACTSTGGSGSSASFLMVSISVMATLIMIFF